MNDKNLPEFLIKMLEEQYGSKILEQIVNGYNANRFTTFRINTLKSKPSIIESELISKNIQFEKVLWSEDAIIVKNVPKREIENLKMYQNGEIYLQSLSSMLPPIVLEPKINNDILDMAAAPGGKTTQMAAMTNNKARITACEMNKIRIERLKYNIEKQGASSVYIMQIDSRKIDDFFAFDQILLDAPCSGSGTINLNDSKLNEKFNIKLIERSKSLQLELFKKALKILKPGKEMVYSTCSILSSENEEIIEKCLDDKKAEIVPIEFEGMKDLPLLPTKIDGTICVCPNELYEGFFVAKIRKKQ